MDQSRSEKKDQIFLTERNESTTYQKLQDTLKVVIRMKFTDTANDLKQTKERK